MKLKLLFGLSITGILALVANTAVAGCDVSPISSKQIPTVEELKLSCFYPSVVTLSQLMILYEDIGTKKKTDITKKKPGVSFETEAKQFVDRLCEPQAFAAYKELCQKDVDESVQKICATKQSRAEGIKGAVDSFKQRALYEIFDVTGEYAMVAYLQSRTLETTDMPHVKRVTALSDGSVTFDLCPRYMDLRSDVKAMSAKQNVSYKETKTGFVLNAKKAVEEAMKTLIQTQNK